MVASAAVGPIFSVQYVLLMKVRWAAFMIAERPITGLENVGDGLVLTDLGPWPAQPYWPGWMTHEDELRAFGRAIAWLGVVPVLVHTIWLAARRRLFRRVEAPRLVMLALLGSMVLTLFLYLGDPRLRVSFDPLLLALAADAWRRAAAAVLRW